MATAAEMLTAVFAALDRGERIEDLMRADERAAGHRVVLPGEEPWFPVDEWSPTCVVSVTTRGDVRLVAIMAAQPGNGAFRRLVAAVRDAGLRPVVVAPSKALAQALKRWGWRERQVGRGWHSERRWMPPCSRTSR